MSENTTVELSQDEFDKLPRVSMGRRELLIGLAAGTVVPLSVSGCATDGGVGQFLVSDQQIMQASQMAWQEALRENPVSRDPGMRRRVERVGQRIVPASGLTQYQWEFVVFENDQQNAWVLPNGKVAFYSGLLDIMANDDQVATVMGHEVGHVRANHAAQRARQQAAAGLGLAVVGAGLGAADVENSGQWAAILGAGLTFGVLLPYSRQHELEADRLGVDYMNAARYRPSEALDFWRTMSARNQRQPMELMSTHPSNQTRMAALESHIQSRGYA
ncbi:MAG: M48 family metallopeptidase [Alphaproteobacteria bacterium]|nr:M48 family metallopeptidase [Alphaproteobacteria bacterium]